MLAESVAGTSHRQRGVACQDAYRVRHFGARDEWLAVAVADGAGSASHSEIGANKACESLAALADQLSEQPVTVEAAERLFTTVRGHMSAEAERLETKLRNLACTALLAVVGPKFACFAQIGDGAIVVGDGTSLRCVFWPDQGEYANQTSFLTDETFSASLRFETTDEPITGLAILTDGLQRLALDFSTSTPYARFFDPMFRRMRSAEMNELRDSFRLFLDSPAINERTDDDKTLILGVRRP